MNEVSRSLPKDILVGRTLVNLKSPGFPVRVVNVSDSTRLISKGTGLAKCELVEYVSSVEQSSTPTTDAELPSHLGDLFKRSSVNLDCDQKDKLHC